jgi:hypothetical protein
MNDMRKLINLMEGVTAVPGLNEKSTSEKQARFMAAAAHDPKFAKKAGIDSSVAKEFNKADTGTKQLSNAMSESNYTAFMSADDEAKIRHLMMKYDLNREEAENTLYHPEPSDDSNDLFGDLSEEDESDMQTQGTIGRDMDDAQYDMAQGIATESVPAVRSCQQTNPATADVACAMEDRTVTNEVSFSNFDDIDSQIAHILRVSDDVFRTQDEALEEVSRYLNREGFSSDEIFQIMDNVEKYLHDQHMRDSGPSDAEVMNMANMHDRDEEDMPFEESLQNGYEDVNYATGSDYFPNGADSPVVKATGPSGARHGDNPEQKKMQVAETHKELVYAYRNYLKESATETQKKKLVESAVVSNLELENWFSDFEDEGDSITYNGMMYMIGEAKNRKGETIGVGFTVNISASCGYELVDDSQPNGWNYRTEQPTYSKSQALEIDDPVIKNIQFAPGEEFFVGDDEMPLAEVQKYIDPNVLKQLLNPQNYMKTLGKIFHDKAEQKYLRSGR